MYVKLIKTDGPWLPATIQHGDRQFCVMDEFTIDERFAPKPNEDFEVELSALVEKDTSWEEMFANNPYNTKGIEPLKGWSYRVFGQIVSINPVVVDCGILSIPDALHTNDSRVVGEYIAFTISRLVATQYLTKNTDKAGILVDEEENGTFKSFLKNLFKTEK